MQFAITLDKQRDEPVLIDAFPIEYDEYDDLLKPSLSFDPLAEGLRLEAPFYFGIGITEVETYSVIEGYGNVLCATITTVHSGYSAEAAGLEVGDMIFQVNDMPITSTNEIRGDRAGNIVLTVLKRDGRIQKMLVPRVKIYLE